MYGLTGAIRKVKIARLKGRDRPCHFSLRLLNIPESPPYDAGERNKTYYGFIMRADISSESQITPDRLLIMHKMRRVYRFTGPVAICIFFSYANDMTKYRQAVAQMLSENKELFDEFRPIHEAYVINPDANQAKFNAAGAPVMDIIREYERKLCAKMGAGQYSKFSANLSEKFMEEVQKEFPKIMFVGVVRT